ncbi:unnamed protein product [Rotaria sp. Silwood1]|nr:unnamed protein product [Rotaria sp. Silwood1]CAF1297414.1 unnamed protein product [Rotaria sp. Silwood1]CAF3505943.1 unnamed protein product [Rotaria sp. Silwood1]CAF4806126.1 unnamed protein product [Rotaria sp. Silwood1]
MFYSLFLICLLINIDYTQNTQCSFLNSKLNKFGIHINIYEKDFIGLTLCQNLINNYCCPQIYEDKIQNATIIELYQLFDFYSINLYELLKQITFQLNETIIKLIESSRNETHSIFKYNYKTIYNYYRSSIDLFFNKLLLISYKNYQYDIKNNIEELLRNILRITIMLNNYNHNNNNNNKNKPILSSYLLCLWRNHPFGNRQYLIVNQLEMNLGKLFHLNELFKLSNELIQVMPTSVTTDNHCIDSYMQLSYCNLCSGRKELPCLSNCINIIESCLINISLINDVWINFIDSIENNAYFNGIEKALSSIGKSISDALMTLFNSDGVQNKDEYSNSLSILDQQLRYMRQSLQIYRSFWLILPEQICKSNGHSISTQKTCWTGTSISLDDKQSIRTTYDKPLSLRLQRILKEMKEKSQMISNIQRITTGINISTTTARNSLLIDGLKLNLTDDFDDYPDDNEFDYADYAYEDSIDELSSSIQTTSSTTLQSSSISVYDDLFIDDINTVSYYDYGEQDAYSDDEIDETYTQKLSSSSTVSTITTIVKIPSYHQRQPVIWNINIDDDFHKKSQQQYNSSFSHNYSLLLLLSLLIFILK